MKNLLLLALFCILVLPACKKNPTDHTTNITNARKWSGYHSRGYYEPIANNDSFNFNYTIADTTLAVLKIDNNTVQFPWVNIQLAYKTTDGANHIISFDSSTTASLGAATLTYYYQADSLVFSYTAISPLGKYGMDDPLLENYYLSSHN